MGVISLLLGLMSCSCAGLGIVSSFFGATSMEAQRAQMEATGMQLDESAFEQLIEAQGGGADMSGMMEGIIGAGFGITLCIGGGWALAKIGFYGWSLHYCRTPAIRTRLAPHSPQPAVY